MWKNVYDHLLSSSFKEAKRWSASLNHSFIEENYPYSQGIYLSEKTLNKYKANAEANVSQIQDPLWQKVCNDILGVLGPIAFKDFWKINLINVSVDGKRAYFSCPNEVLALTLQHYHFVIIGALKRFYPFLTSIEVEISKNKARNIPANESLKFSANLHQYITPFS